MEIEEIKKYIRLLEDCNLKKIAFKTKDFELELERESLHSFFPHKVDEKPVSPPIAKDAKSHEDKKIYITSPMVGTYYSASGPDQSPFVKVGDTVRENTVVCIVEAMKVMNEVKAGKSGVIKEILIENSQPVEYGTKLFVIE